ncbi:hypothetical protein ACMDCR_10265 [Labrys okinawensis]|uniref:hypothetical protein n=1 Tax=Labrys okinawensis TaxID=346911 RepID=UPI0039BD4D49
MLGSQTSESWSSQLVVNSSMTATEFESALDRALSKGERPLLRLPTEWDLAKGPGGAARAAQLVATWARNVSKPDLAIYATGADDVVAIDRFVKQLHGLSGAMLASRILANDGRTEITREVNASAKSRVDAMNSLDIRGLQRGQAIDLVCVDPSSLARLRPFYYPTGEDSFRSPAEFESLVWDLIRESSHSYASSMATVVKDLAEALRELFVNTHIHARRDAEGVRYRRGVRGVIVAQRNVKRQIIAQFSMGLPPLVSYLAALTHVERRDTLKMIELTVFDSGPGLAARINEASLPEGMSIEIEHRLVEKCFLKNATSVGRPGYGLGLTRVLHMLKERSGFLFLRTGRLTLFRAFPPGGYSPQEIVLEKSDFELERLQDVGGEAQRQVSGAVITLLLPVGIAFE